MKTPIRVFVKWLVMARLRTCVSSGAAYIAGVGFTNPEWGGIHTAGLGIAVLVPALANVHNTFTDVSEDERNTPGRSSLTRGSDASQLRGLCMAAAGAIAIYCAVAGVAVLLIGCAGLLLLWQYSAPPFRLKARPVAGLLVFACVGTVPFVAGAATWSSWTGPPLVNWSYLSPGVAITLLYLAKGLVKNLPDRQGDLEAGLRTSATAMPTLKAAAQASIVTTAIAYSVSAGLLFATGGGDWFVLLLCACGVASVTGQATYFLQERHFESMNRAMAIDMYVTTTAVFACLFAATPFPGVACSYMLCCVVVLVLIEILHLDSRNLSVRQKGAEISDEAI